jgi:pimeloyl-ACP methyl ester carboxylesterase
MAETTANGIRFHYQSLGAGLGDDRLVVFLHGLVMDNLSSWYFTIANPVACHAEVLLYDLRGHGKTERPKSGYSVDHQVDDLKALLDTLGHADRPLELVGNSFGGLLALSFARRYPELVRGLALVDAQVHNESWGEEMRASLSLEGDDLMKAIETNFQHWLGRHSKRKRNRLGSNAYELVHQTSMIEDLISSPAPPQDGLELLPFPVRAIYGEHSDVRERGEQLAASFRDCELTIHADSTHSVLWEQTRIVRDAVLTWTTRDLPKRAPD